MAAPIVTRPVSLPSESPAVAETAEIAKTVPRQAKDDVETTRSDGTDTHPADASAGADSVEAGSRGIDSRETDSRETDSREADSREAEPSADSDDDDQSGSVERRENRMFTLLVALIGVVVVVLIAELVLILFVLNHSSNTKRQSIRSQTSSFVYYPSTNPQGRTA